MISKGFGNEPSIRIAGYRAHSSRYEIHTGTDGRAVSWYVRYCSRIPSGWRKPDDLLRGRCAIARTLPLARGRTMARPTTTREDRTFMLSLMRPRSSGATVAAPDAAQIRVANELKAVSYTHLTLPTNREV